MNLVMTFGWLLAGLTAIVVVVELAARASIRRRQEYFVLPPGLRMRQHIDPGVSPHLERVTRFEVNGDGERGGDVPSGDVYRVLVAGGSQPEGYLLDQDTAWPGALQRLLQTPDRLRALGATQVHVGSIARSGVGSEAVDLILRRVLPRYARLQLLIIMVGATDVLRWLEQDAAETIAPVRTADVFRCHPESAFGWTPGRLAAGEVLRRAWRRTFRPIEIHERAGRWVTTARDMRARATDVRTAMPDPTPMLDHFGHHFSQLLVQAKAHAERVLVVRQPWLDKDFTPDEAARMWHGGAGQPWREPVTRYYSFEVCGRLMARLDAHAADLADAHDVEQLDLMPSLERSLRTYYDGFHLTPAGARAIAATVATAVFDGAAAVPSAAVFVTGSDRHLCVDSQAS